MRFKINNILLLVAVGALLSSCTKEPFNAGADSSQSASGYDDNGSVPGWIRIKLTDDAIPLKVGVFTRGDIESGNPAVDEVASMLGATEIRKVFNDGGKFAERRRKYGFHLWYDLRIDESIPVSRAGREISLIPGIAVVEPIYQTQIAEHIVAPDISQYSYKPAVAVSSLSEEVMPFNDPKLALQWHYDNTGSVGNVTSGFTAGADINVFDVWKQGVVGNPDVIVAVIDGGVQVNHPDIAANMWVNAGEIAGNGIDDDNNGYVDDVHGWNSYTAKKANGVWTNGEITQHYHGTHVAGTVAAVNNNGEGVCGVAGGDGTLNSGVKIMSCQGFVILPSGIKAGTIDPDLFLYATDNGAVIAQNSWNSSSASVPRVMRDAILYFIENAGTDIDENQAGPMSGGLVIFSAGNSNKSNVDTPSQMPEVVCVTAMEPNYKRASYSNYGVDADLYAPGGVLASSSDSMNPRQVYSTYTDSGYAYLSGTSMASPHVSGVAALIVSKFGGIGKDFTAEECKDILLSSYRPMEGYVESKYLEGLGHGLIDASMILTKNPNTPPADVIDLVLESKSDQVVIKAKVPADGNGNAILKIFVDYAKQNTTNWRTETFANRLDVGGTFEVAINFWTEDAYDFLIYTQDRYGNLSGTVSATGKPLPHINVAPKCVSLPWQTMGYIGKDYEKVIMLEKYFSDPDLNYGDYLTYSYGETDPGIVDITLQGSTLTLFPKYKGESNITVTATDSHGASISSKFRVRVENGPIKPSDPGIDPDPDPDPDGDISKAKLSVTNPIGDLLTLSLTEIAGVMCSAELYDSASRRVWHETGDVDSEGKIEMNVSGVTPGLYKLLVTVSGRTFNVNVIKK